MRHLGSPSMSLLSGIGTAPDGQRPSGGRVGRLKDGEGTVVRGPLSPSFSADGGLPRDAKGRTPNEP